MTQEFAPRYTVHAHIRSDTAELQRFPDSSVQEIVLDGTFEELELLQKDGTVSEWFRVLKPKGSLTIRLSKNGNKGFLKHEDFQPDVHPFPPPLTGEGEGGGDKKQSPAGGDANSGWKPGFQSALGPGLGVEEPGTMYRRAQELIQDGRNEEAIEVLKRFLETDPNHSGAHDDLGALYFQNGARQQALDHFLSAVETDPENLNARMNLADLLLHSGRHEEAFHYYQEILGKRPNEPDALKGAAKACDAAGLEGDARFFFARAEEVGSAGMPDRSDPQGAAILLRPEHGQEQRCAEIGGGELSFFPGEKQPGPAVIPDPGTPEPGAAFDRTKYLSEGEKLFEEGDLAGARRVFEEALAEAPDDPEILNNLGTVALMDGDGERAIADFHRALRANPDYFEAQANLGNTLAGAGDYHGALPWLKKAADHRPGDVDLLNAWGYCLLQTGDLQTASGVYLRSSQLDSSQEVVAEILKELKNMRS